MAVGEDLHGGTALRPPGRPAPGNDDIDLRPAHSGASPAVLRPLLLWGRAIGAAAMAAGAITALRLAGLLVGPTALVVTVVLVLAIPTSRVLSRRILLAGSLALGWLPVLWWWQLPVGAAGRMTILLAAVAGGLAAWLAGAPRPRDRWQRVVPDLAAVDALPPLAALAAAVYLAPWLRPASPAAALSMLNVGWDHSAHFDMVEMIRRHGVVVSGVALPTDGTEWSYIGYPQGFHALAAAIMELLHGTVLGTPAEEVLVYTIVLGLIGTGLVLLVTAGLCALPGLRSRPGLALPLVALGAAAFVLGPGGSALSDGFPNFLLACGLLCCVPLLVVQARRCTDLLTMAALGGGLVGVAHGWLLLLVMGLPAAAVVALPLRRARWKAVRRTWVGLGVVCAATAAAGANALAAVAGQGVGNVLVIPGAGTSLSIREVLVAVALVVAAPLALTMRSRRGGWSEEAVRAVALVVACVVGAAFAAWIAWLQMRATGALGYYFWKFSAALALVAVVTGLAAVASLPRMPAPPTRRPAQRLLVPMIAALVPLVAFGAPHPLVQSQWLPASRGLAGRVTVAMAAADPGAEANRLLTAAAAPGAGSGLAIYIGTGADGRLNPGSAAQWYSALVGTWTEESNALAMRIVSDNLSVQVTASRAGEILHDDSRATVLVPPEHLGAVQAALPAGTDRRRVQTW